MVHQGSSLFVVLVMVAVFVSWVEGRPSISEGGPNPTALCKLPAAKGHCRALLPRWMYNPTTGKCQQFDFGGCDGNANNFMSYKECMNACGGIS